ncbi:MAG: methyltransferase domain-containing protein [Syntrophobacteraceae bacterium]|nr:methyltransferase domain-containing protein [Syntrophobacteraceae bacterium]
MERSDTLRGDVAAIELPDYSVNLVVSRGSVFFWEDCRGAFKELYRVLAPGGVGYIGGGLGRPRFANRSRNGCWKAMMAERVFGKGLRAI